MTVTVAAFKDYLKKIKSYEEALNLMAWDLRTMIPKKGMDQRSDVIGQLSETIHTLKTSDEMKQFLEELPKKVTDDPVMKKMLDVCQRDYDRDSKIPTAEYTAFVTLRSKAETVWQEARENNDFSLLMPYLEQLVEYNQRFSDYWGYKDNRYNGLLDQYEPGLTTDVLDPVFDELKLALATLVKKIQQSEVEVDASQLLHYFPKDKQQAFSLSVLDKMGYDFDAGRLDETIHPFAIGINQGDVRVTTRYDEQDFRTAIFGTIHEGGHALYEQNIDAAFALTPLAEGTSMGIHESQSLFWENFIGRSEAFWKSQYKSFLSFAPEAFQTIEQSDFYRAINEVKPSYIRIEADELTYSLHIIIRYELEKALIDGSLKVKDLPEAWNDKMESYLGIRPTTDREGVLQDIHWAGGDFGYFPTYALGYMYAAQLHEAMGKDINIPMMIQTNDFEPMKEWLTEHVHRHGRMKQPLEIITDVTGEGLNPDYLVNYLTDKYQAIYQFD
ncbi:carboxypeptidase Taq [Halolactibacillus halophilus]|uniref:Metal-dependent carboxypeptidase n=1 Tax=Halolactibacillus halophilus TaxID=306540 RepID=A0A1I5NTL0_9BACI|nr:carboxypeptidase M32 [Halolactibacillus halophilus]GEM01438.1 carboxypeptidase M32 [Halolactibacillus halophilus]SFP25112.1 carboxypeptidase Taq [Halolactibacillus halophilus]